MSGDSDGPKIGQPRRHENGVWWFGYRHARDIPNELFFDAVRAARGNWTPEWAMVDDVQAVLAGLPLTKSRYPEEFPGVPRKVVLAKARRLILRGVLGGCWCGCRGDFEILGETP
jgi:hypothetical protein